MTPNLFVVFFCSDVFLRIERVCASFYQMVCIYTMCIFFFFFYSQHATHNLAFLVHLAVLSVGGVREKRGGEGKYCEY